MFRGSRKSVAVAVLLIAAAAYASVRIQGKRLWGRTQTSSAVSLPGFNAATQLQFAQSFSALPPCSLLISGTFDKDCVFQCLPWGDGGINCYDNQGAPLGTMTQPTNPAPVISSSGFPLADGGWLPQWEFPDDTLGSAGIAHVDSAAIQGMFGSAHTFIYEGYMGSTAPDPVGWFVGAGPQGNLMQLRRGGGNQLQFLEQPNVATSGGECFDAWCSMMAKRESDGGINIAQAGNKSTTVATTMTNLSAGQKLDLGGYSNNVCCAPAGSQGGIFGSFTGYGPDDAGQAKADSFLEVCNRRLEGAQAVASGAGTQIGSVGTRLIKYDLDKPGGGLSVLGIGDYLLDSVSGTVTNETYHELGPADALDGGVLVGSATWRGHFDRGPLFAWRHKNSAGVLSSEDGGFAGEELGSGTVAAHTVMDYNAWFIGTAFTDAGYAVNNTYWIQNQCIGGTIDGGFDHCTGTLAGGGVFARYPTFGCPMICSNTSGSSITAKSILYVGNDAGQTAALEIQLINMKDSLEPQVPNPTNAQVSAQYLEVDAGSFIPRGCTAGKITSVFQAQYSAIWYPATLDENAPPGAGFYLFDISNDALSHDMLLWGTVELTNETRDAGNVSTLDAVMYGDDSNYIFPNKFAKASPAAQYNGAPYRFVAGTYYGASIEWDVETGTLPDGGTGQGSRATIRLDPCAVQAPPWSACNPQTIVNQNTGQLGLCPGAPNRFEIGTRALGSSPTDSRVAETRVCSCPAAQCSGDCK